MASSRVENKKAAKSKKKEDGSVKALLSSIFNRLYPLKKYWFTNWKKLDKREVLSYGRIDTKFFLLIMILLVIGLIAMFSAGYVNAMSLKKYGYNPYYFIIRQLKFVIGGLIIMYVASRINYRVYRDWSMTAFTVAMILLVLVLKLHGSAEGAGDDTFKRWLVIGSVRLFQPSEIAKVALIMYCAWSMDLHKKAIATDWKMMFLYMGVVGAMCVLIILEKHLSCTILVGLLGITMTYLGGIDKRWYPLVALCIVGGAVFMVVFKNKLPAYAAERIVAWLDKDYDPSGARWQTNQSLYAIGSGGIFGVGLGNSKQKHLYVSEPQNDFVFSIFCEEMGLVGALVVIILFVLLVKRAFEIAMSSKSTYASLLVMGIAVQVGLQAALNIAVVTDLIPNTGISLPFFSYGGTALMILLGEMGIVLSVSRGVRMKKM